MVTEAKTPKSALREWTEAACIALVAILTLYFVFWPVRIDGDSMEDTLHNGDRMCISRLMFNAGLVHRGDIVVCTVDEQQGVDGRRDIIKRLIGLPGDHIEIKEGQVWVNGELQDEPYVGSVHTNGCVDCVLASDEYYVMGDNRDVSEDSRIMGPIPKSRMVARVILRWYPFNQVRLY